MGNPKQPTRGGARPGAGRPKGSKTRKRVGLIPAAQPTEPTGEFDAEAVLRSIAADPAAPASARVAAAKALLRPTPAAPTGGSHEHLLGDLNAKALQLMGARGNA